VLRYNFCIYANSGYLAYDIWVISFMNPCELNAAIAAITNYLYCALSKEDFICLSVFLNELSKSMFSTTLFRDLCYKDGKFKPDK